MSTSTMNCIQSSCSNIFLPVPRTLPGTELGQLEQLLDSSSYYPLEEESLMVAEVEVLEHHIAVQVVEDEVAYVVVEVRAFLVVDAVGVLIRHLLGHDSPRLFLCTPWR